MENYPLSLSEGQTSPVWSFSRLMCVFPLHNELSDGELKWNCLVQFRNTDGGSCRCVAGTAYFRDTGLKKWVMYDARSTVIGGIDHRQGGSVASESFLFRGEEKPKMS